MSKKIAWVSIGIIIIAATIVLSANRARPGARVGVIVPLSGDIAPIGEKVRNGIELAMKSEGLGDRVSLTYEDGKIEPRNALTAYQKLASVDKAGIFLGPFGPDQIMPIAPLLGSDDVLIGVTLCEDRFKKFPQVFCTYPSIPAQTQSGIDAIKKAGVKRLAFMTQLGQIGDVIEGSIKAGQDDYTIVADERFNTGEKDFRTILLKLMATKPDGIYFASLPDEGYLILKQLHDMHYPGKIFAVFDAVEEKLQELGPAAEGVFLPGHISPKFDKGFTAAYAKAYGSDPDLYAALGYSMAVTLAESLKENGYSSHGLANKLIGRADATAIRGFSFNTDRTVSIPVESLIFKDGKIRELTARDF